MNFLKIRSGSADIIYEIYPVLSSSLPIFIIIYSVKLYNIVSTVYYSQHSTVKRLASLVHSLPNFYEFEKFSKIREF